MLNLNTKNESPLNTYNNNNINNNSILAFKPRQVILSAHHHPKPTTTMNLVSNESKYTNLTPETKVKLDALILNYLNRNGFNKTLKRFQSEARIQTDTWKASSLHLEDIFCKYNACNADGNKNTSKKPVSGQDKLIDYDNVCPTNKEPTTKKKKKKGTNGSENGAITDQSEVLDTQIVECDTERVDEPEIKPKKKKKTKHDLGSSSQAEVKIDTINGLEIDDSTKKTKEKKKKSMQQDKVTPSTTNDNELVIGDGEKERKKKKKKSTADGAVKAKEANIVKMDAGSEKMSSKEKKSSKKRKRSLSDENENVSNEVTISEESKCQKIQTFEEEEKRKKEKINPQETSNKQLDGQTNGELETNGGEKPDAKKSTKRQRNVTDEPKTVNAFQRVKIDQVEFADEKLQDNSYWAKDGADIGYGAKAQEVLGQVRGRDFRHEKTKKKRGSYRGGPIDLQSHSIKFNYSDQD